MPPGHVFLALVLFRRAGRVPITLGLLFRVLGRDVRVEEGRVVGLARMDLRLGRARTQHSRRALERAARAVRREEVVDGHAAHRVENLRPRRALVHPRVGLILKLARQEPAVLLGELLGLDDHASALVRGIGQDDLGAKKSHQFPPLDRE